MGGHSNNIYLRRCRGKTAAKSVFRIAQRLRMLLREYAYSDSMFHALPLRDNATKALVASKSTQRELHEVPLALIESRKE
jgi:hypothetical protein